MLSETGLQLTSSRLLHDLPYRSSLAKTVIVVNLHILLYIEHQDTSYVYIKRTLKQKAKFVI